MQSDGQRDSEGGFSDLEDYVGTALVRSSQTGHERYDAMRGRRMTKKLRMRLSYTLVLSNVLLMIGLLGLGARAFASAAISDSIYLAAFGVLLITLTMYFVLHRPLAGAAIDWKIWALPRLGRDQFSNTRHRGSMIAEVRWYKGRTGPRSRANGGLGSLPDLGWLPANAYSVHNWAASRLSVVAFWANEKEGTHVQTAVVRRLSYMWCCFREALCAAVWCSALRATRESEAFRC